MSSIRPLATITVLAFVGVFLYMKINETEPPLPEGVEDWSAATEIDFDMVGTEPSAGPQFQTAPAGGNAPTFSAGTVATTEASRDSALAPGPGNSAAPSWTDTPPPFGSAGVDESASNNAGGIAAPQLPSLPPLPDLPQNSPRQPSLGGLAENQLGSTPQTVETIEGPSANVPPALGQPTPPPAMGETASPRFAANPRTSRPVQAQSTPFSATRLAVQAALDRRELSQALLLLSDWHGDPSLSPSEATEVNGLLSQLAGSVIYSTEHRLEPPYMVQAGERLEAIAKKYDVPWQLLKKINNITSADPLQPGQQLKVVRGPFSALIDISQRKMTLMLDRRYAGRFTLNLDPSVTVEEGQWEVNQKLLTPANVSLPGASPTASTEERSLMLSSTSAGASQVAILRGATTANSLTDPAGRVLRLNPADAADVFDILSLGSKVVIRR